MFFQRKHMYVPTYQRSYTWKRENVNRLLEDIERAIERIKKNEKEDDGNKKVEENHYIGTVYIQEKNTGEWELIDGQQRVTTLTLLIQAIINNISDIEGEYNEEDASDEDAEEHAKLLKSKDFWNTEFLVDRETGENKVELSYDDEKDLEELRENGDKRGTSAIKTNYRIIDKWIRENFIEKEIDLGDIILATDRLRIIEVALSEKDNSQVIFDGINATGQPLQTGDQVKNYLLMSYGKQKQQDLYMKYWRPIELGVGVADNYRTVQTIFLTVLLGNQINNNKRLNKYEEFKFFKMKFDLDNEEYLKEFKDFYDIYVKIEENDFKNTKIKEPMKRIAYTIFKETESKGYIIQIVKHLIDGHIDEEEFIRAIDVLEGYILRRILADGYKKSGSHFNYLHRKVLERIEHTGQTYSASLKQILNSEIGNKTPTDWEILLTVGTLNIYRSKTYNFTRYLLERIENGGTKEQMDIYTDSKRYTIEHIMPQTLSEEWKSQLGESQVEQASIYKDTLGNLTLTGYNSEYSNKTFEEKMEVVNGYRDSRFINLNKSVVNKTSWGINTIKNRTEELAQRVMDMYPYE